MMAPEEIGSIVAGAVVDSLLDASVLQAFFVFAGLVVVTGGGIITLLIKLRSSRKKNDENTAATLAEVTDIKEHVANNHSSNLRVDLDEKFDAVFKRFDSMENKFDEHKIEVSDEFRGIRRDIGQLRGDFEGERVRIRGVEDSAAKRRRAAR